MSSVKRDYKFVILVLIWAYFFICFGIGKKFLKEIKSMMLPHNNDKY